MSLQPALRLLEATRAKLSLREVGSSSHADILADMLELDELVQKLAKQKHKQILSSNHDDDDEAATYVPMYGPKHIARVVQLEEDYAQLQAEVQRLPAEALSPPLPPPPSSEVNLPPESSSHYQITPPTILRAGVDAQLVEEQRQIELNAQLAKQSAARMKQDAVERELAELDSGGSGMSLQQCIAAVQDGERRLAVGQILEQICQRPERADFRTLKTSNQAVNELITSVGVKPLLFALGFRPKYVPGDGEDEVMAYFLPEPDLERDYDGWSGWYDALKMAGAQLLL